MSAQFFETIMGKRFIEGTMPSIMRSLDRIADALEKMNGKAHVPQWDGHGTIFDEITKVSPEVKDALKVIAEDVVMSKSAILKAAAEKELSVCGSGINLKGATNDAD